MGKTKKEKLLQSLYSDPKYAGKYVIVLGDKIHAHRSGKKHNQALEELLVANPKETPVITYIPKEETLILILR